MVEKTIPNLSIQTSDELTIRGSLKMAYKVRDTLKFVYAEGYTPTTRTKKIVSKLFQNFGHNFVSII